MADTSSMPASPPCEYIDVALHFQQMIREPLISGSRRHHRRDRRALRRTLDRRHARRRRHRRSLLRPAPASAQARSRLAPSAPTFGAPSLAASVRAGIVFGMARLSAKERAQLPDRAFAYIDASGNRQAPDQRRATRPERARAGSNGCGSKTTPRVNAPACGCSTPRRSTASCPWGSSRASSDPSAPHAHRTSPRSRPVRSRSCSPTSRHRRRAAHARGPVRSPAARCSCGDP